MLKFGFFFTKSQQQHVNVTASDVKVLPLRKDTPVLPNVHAT